MPFWPGLESWGPHSIRGTDDLHPCSPSSSSQPCFLLLLADSCPYGSQTGRVCIGFGMEEGQRHTVPSAGLVSRPGQGLGWAVVMCPPPWARWCPLPSFPAGGGALDACPTLAFWATPHSPCSLAAQASPLADPWREGALRSSQPRRGSGQC